MARGQLARFKKSNGALRKGNRQLKGAYKAYAPSVANTLTVGSGGFLAGVVATGEYIPSEIAGISSPLVIGGLLASYGIFVGGNASVKDDQIAKIAVNLGNGMISAWAYEYAQDMVGTTQTLSQDQAIK